MRGECDIKKGKFDYVIRKWQYGIFFQEATRKEIYVGHGNMIYILKFIHLAIGKVSQS